MIFKILSDENFKNKIYNIKYSKKRILKASIYNIKKTKKKIYNNNKIIIEKKKFSPILGNNKKFNIKIFKKIFIKKNILIHSNLTNTKLFKGKIFIKKNINYLRKDFITNYLQLLISIINGYNFVLLIKKILGEKKIKNMCKISNFLGIKPIIEIDNIKDLIKIIKLKIKNIFIGINTRDLKNFNIKNNNFIFNIKNKKMIIYESGIKNKNMMLKINNLGFKITLIGKNITKKNFFYEKTNKIY